MKKIISSLSRASSFSFSIQTVQSRWDRVVAESTTLPSLSGEQATSLLYIALKSVSERISKSDTSRSQKAQRLLSRLEQRQHDLNEVLQAVKENAIELVGIIGWGKNTIQPGILKRGEGVSDYHAVVFRKNGKLFIEELGSSKVLFEQPTVDQRLKTDESPCLYVLDNTEENSPVPYSTKGRVYDVQGTTYDSGAYTTTSDKGTRYVVEAPLGNTMVAQIPRRITHEHVFGGVLHDARLSDSLKGEDPVLHLTKESQFRFGYVLYSNLNDYEKDSFSSVTNVVLISKSPLAQLELLFSEDTRFFKPDSAMRITNVMCNASCTPTLNVAALARESFSDGFFQAMYLENEYSVENVLNSLSRDPQKNGRLFVKDLDVQEVRDAIGNLKAEVAVLACSMLE